jgi:hypothetical protein
MTADWSVPDPAEATGNEAEVRYAFADTLRMLTNRPPRQVGDGEREPARQRERDQEPRRLGL